jgi:hypothetical protein
VQGWHLQFTIDFGPAYPHNQSAVVEANMVTVPPMAGETTVLDRKLSGIGATEDEVDVRGTIPQRIDKRGTKIEDIAGTGDIDSSGG